MRKALRAPKDSTCRPFASLYLKLPVAPGKQRQVAAGPLTQEKPCHTCRSKWRALTFLGHSWRLVVAAASLPTLLGRPSSNGIAVYIYLSLTGCTQSTEPTSILFRSLTLLGCFWSHACGGHTQRNNFEPLLQSEHGNWYQIN